MIPDPYASQRRIKQEHREKILSLLNDKTRTFTELQKITGFSPMGLTNMLKGLMEEKKIKKVDNERKSPYQLADRGMYIKEYLFLGNILSEIREKGGKYYVDYQDHTSSGIPPYSPPWGMFSHLFIDKDLGKKNNPFLKINIFEIEKFIFDKIRDNMSTSKVNFDKTKQGKIVLAYEIDYQGLLKAITENSEKDIKTYVRERTKEIELNQ